MRAELDNFNETFGNKIVRDIRAHDLENYLQQCAMQDRQAATIDYELAIAKSMIKKGFDDDLIGPSVLKVFRKTKKILWPGDNARQRILSVEEYFKPFEYSPVHSKPVLIMTYNC